ncbi:zinc ribbon domain-containing protein [Breznakiellaceae bacterium SP9]
MAMEEVFENLRDLQTLLSERISLEHDIQEIPKTITTQEETLAKLKKSFIEKNQDYENTKAQTNIFRELLIEAELKREHSEKNMDSIATQREYDALDKEISDAANKEQQYRKDLQKEERKLAEIDEKMKTDTALIERMDLELAERRESVEAEIERKRGQIESLASREKELIDVLDPDLHFKFERIIRNKGGQGIVAIKGGVCMGCHMILPVQFANEVRLGDDIKDIVFCPYCSRVLFYEESEQGEEEFFDTGDSGSLSDLDDMEDEEDEDDEDEEKEVTIDYEE